MYMARGIYNTQYFYRYFHRASISQREYNETHLSNTYLARGIQLECL